jgi:hypothetical protein
MALDKKEIQKIWLKFADDILNASKRELGVKRIGKNRNYGVATRTLQKNLVYKFRYGNKGVTSIKFHAKGKAKAYAPFIHFGVNGTEVNRGSQFTFKKQPPPKAIKAWIRNKPIRMRDQSSGQFVKKTKNLENQVAFLLGRAIKRKGIVGLRYFERGYEYALKKNKTQLEIALANSFARQLSAQIGNVTIKAKF